jgi:hypothetical protein
MFLSSNFDKFNHVLVSENYSILKTKICFPQKKKIRLKFVSIFENFKTQNKKLLWTTSKLKYHIDSSNQIFNWDKIYKLFYRIISLLSLTIKH